MTITSNPPFVVDADYVQLERLALEINWRIDSGAGETLPELFTEAGSINTLGEPVVGHDAIRQWGAAMSAPDSPIAGIHHLLTNFRFLADGADAAIGTFYVTAFLHGAPQTPGTLPFAMGQVTDRYLRTDAGWKAESRVFQPFFLREPIG